MTDTPQKLTAETLGTGFLVATVVGSGIMAERLTDDVALQLLANTLPTGAILIVLITVLGPLSGAHFNPAVTLAFWLRGEIKGTLALAYVALQCVGGLLGTWAAHLMFEEALWQLSSTVRTGGAQWFAEVIAAFGLVFMILGGLRTNAAAVPWLVGLYITAAYWFTASTSFANPAVAFGRAFTDTFSGIRPLDMPGFVIAQLIGATIATVLVKWLFFKVGSDPET